MDPLTISALIGASATMLKGLFDSQQAAEQRKRDAVKEGLKTQALGAAAYPASQQNAFNSLMSAYGKALGV